jgi:transcriptional regulator with XRE-family HTH domain
VPNQEVEILMGKAPRARPTRLGEKIFEIRRKLGLSQNGLIRQLGLTEKLFQGDVSAWELGNREPDLPTLLLLARTAGVYVDVLIDDALDLPEKLPANQRGSEVDGKRFSKRITKGRAKSKHTMHKQSD